MAKRGGKDVHVVKNPDGRWDTKKGSRVLSTSRTQANAIKKGKTRAGRDRVDLVIHGRDGKIRSKDSYGDESPRRDTEH
jgi:Uncharacterized protein conserved in bacteria (DUF2188)